MPPIRTHIEEVPLTDTQRQMAQSLTGKLITTSIGGIGDRGKISQIAKGKNCDSNKPGFIADRIRSWKGESTIVWCHYNDEQDSMERILPDAVSISGSTPEGKRLGIVNEFKSGTATELITKPKILGFGVNLQIATRQVWSGLKDSYEEFYQGVKRSNRVGSTKPLDVHIPVTELEYPFVENVLEKADRVQSDTEEQEKLFKEIGYEFL